LPHSWPSAWFVQRLLSMIALTTLGTRQFDFQHVRLPPGPAPIPVARSLDRLQLESLHRVPGLEVPESSKGDHALLTSDRAIATPAQTELADAAGPERAPVPRDPDEAALGNLSFEHPTPGQHGSPPHALDLGQHLGPPLAHQSVLVGWPLHGAQVS
jgi:hypothetical protein